MLVIVPVMADDNAMPMLPLAMAAMNDNDNGSDNAMQDAMQ